MGAEEEKNIILVFSGRGWKQMIFKTLSNPNHSTILNTDKGN